MEEVSVSLPRLRNAVTPAPTSATRARGDLGEQLLAGGVAGDGLSMGDDLAQDAVAKGAAGDGSLIDRPLVKVAMLICFWGLFVIDDFGVQHWGGKFCSAAHWSWLTALYAVVIVATFAGGISAQRSQRVRDAERVAFTDGDITYTAKMTIVLPLLALAVGVVSGLLGLGGGELMAPLLLAIGMIPQVASATSAFMVLFTSSADIVKYLFLSTLSPYMGYVSVAFCLGLTSASVGRITALRLTSKLSHPSIIAFVLGFVLLLACGLLVEQMASKKAEWDFSSPC